MTEERIAIDDHEIPDASPLALAVGDAVSVGDRDTTWPAFVFVETAEGRAGWVPARHLSGPGPRAEAVAAYDTTELPVHAGERVAVLEDDVESGWCWCQAADGREGWVPHEVLEPVPARQVS